MTNWEAIGAIAKVIGSVGVFVSLIYVAVQMRNSNRLARWAAVQKVIDGRTGFNRYISGNPEICSLFWKGLEDPENLSQEDWLRWRMVFSCLARHYESIHFDEVEGLLPRQIVESQKASMDRWLSRPGAVQFFEELGDDFDPSFIRDSVSPLKGKH